MMNHEELMNEALKEAKKALEQDILPVGAILARGGEIIARGHKTMDSDQLSHAEAQILRDVFDRNPGYKRTDGLTVYTTLEPCIMCWGLMRHLPITAVYYAMEDVYGGCAHVSDTHLAVRYQDRPMTVNGGLLREHAREMFRSFLKTTDEPFWAGGGAPGFQKAVLEE